MARPLDIVRLVESRAQLDHNKHFLALLGGSAESIDHLAALGKTIKRNFYRCDLGVVCSLL